MQSSGEGANLEYLISTSTTTTSSHSNFLFDISLDLFGSGDSSDDTTSDSGDTKSSPLATAFSPLGHGMILQDQRAILGLARIRSVGKLGQNLQYAIKFIRKLVVDFNCPGFNHSTHCSATHQSFNFGSET